MVLAPLQKNQASSHSRSESKPLHHYFHPTGNRMATFSRRFQLIALEVCLSVTTLCPGLTQGHKDIETWRGMCDPKESNYVVAIDKQSLGQLVLASLECASHFRTALLSDLVNTLICYKLVVLLGVRCKLA